MLLKLVNDIVIIYILVASHYLVNIIVETNFGRR